MLNSFAVTRVPAQDEALRAPVRAFLAQALREMSVYQRAHSWLAFDAEFSRALAKAGFVGLMLPPEYGGSGRSAFARFVVVEELLSAGAPVGAHWIADRQSAPLILKYGTQAQREFFVPRICRGEAFFCIGMSEPNSGSDLASVRTRASKTETGWRLNGQKIWTTNAHRSHYMIALVRTSGTAQDRQLGLSQFIVDLSLPGINIRPIQDLTGEAHFNEVFFTDVDLPAEALIGAEGAGWQQVTAELAYERSGPERLYSASVLLDEWLAWLRTLPSVPPASVALAGKVVSRLAALRAMSLAVTAKLAQGEAPIVEAALVKDVATELEQYIPIALADAMFADAQVAVPTQLSLALAHVTHVAPSFSLRGGTREVLRGMIARGLGLR